MAVNYFAKHVKYVNYFLIWSVLLQPTTALKERHLSCFDSLTLALYLSAQHSDPHNNEHRAGTVSKSKTFRRACFQNCSEQTVDLCVISICLIIQSSFIILCFNHLRTKLYMSNLKTQFVPRRKHSLPQL